MTSRPMRPWKAVTPPQSTEEQPERLAGVQAWALLPCL